MAWHLEVLFFTKIMGPGDVNAEKFLNCRWVQIPNIKAVLIKFKHALFGIVYAHNHIVFAQQPIKTVANVLYIYFFKRYESYLLPFYLTV